jgi:hypothetical protein
MPDTASEVCGCNGRGFLGLISRIKEKAISRWKR